MSMKEVIDQIKKEAVGVNDHRKRYPGVCPKCGKEMYICKSIAMIEGINTGTGTCIGCGLFLHIEFDSANQRMKLQSFEEATKQAKYRAKIKEACKRVMDDDEQEQD